MGTSGVQWGTVGEWVGGVGALVAIGVTVTLWRFEHRRALKAEEREHRRALDESEARSRAERREIAELRAAKSEKALARAKLLTTSGGGGAQGGPTGDGRRIQHRRDVVVTNDSDDPFMEASFWLEADGGAASSHSLWMEWIPPNSQQVLGTLVFDNMTQAQIDVAAWQIVFTDADGVEWRRFGGLGIVQQNDRDTFAGPPPILRAGPDFEPPPG